MIIMMMLVVVKMTIHRRKKGVVVCHLTRVDAAGRSNLLDVLIYQE